MSERYRPYSAVWLVLRKNTEILFARRYNTGWMDGKYTLGCGGHIEEHETLTQAMVRESREELGIEIDPADLHFAHLNHRCSEDGREYLDVYFYASRWQGEPRIMEPAKCDALEWFQIDSLPTNVIPDLNAILDHISANQFYSEHGWNV